MGGLGGNNSNGGNRQDVYERPVEINFDKEEENKVRLLPTIGTPTVPMGQGDFDYVISERQEVFAVDIPTDWPPPIIPIEPLPEPPTDYWLIPEVVELPQRPVPPPIIIEENNEMSILEEITKIASLYVDFKTAGSPQQTFTTGVPAAAVASPGVPEHAGGVGSSAPRGMVWDPSANCGNGKWRKKYRRRRKVLVTTGDIKGIAALKGVGMVGKSLDTWIATHS